MAKFITLYSGSSGNSTLILDGGRCFLVDMGQSCKRTINALYDLGVSASELDAIFVTHEHSDHVAGLMTYLKHYKTPVYGSYSTLAWMRSGNMVPERAALCPLEHDTPMPFGQTTVSCFGTSHDSADCVGYRFTLSDGQSLAVATDLGYVSDSVRAALSGCALVGLESNYDEQKLLYGRYPANLKSRIRSKLGHLSNVESAQCAAGLAQSGTSKLVLMHLSAENNEPEIALTGCLAALEDGGIGSGQVSVSVAPRHRPGEVIEV